MSYQSETVVNWITTTVETWARAYEPELKKTMYSNAAIHIHQENTRFDKICHPK
jgi:hypothetical protein